MRVTLRYLIHANSASTKDYLLRSSPPQPFPRHRHARVLSKQPTYPLYMNKSVRKGYLGSQVSLPVAALLLFLMCAQNWLNYNNLARFSSTIGSPTNSTNLVLALTLWPTLTSDAASRFAPSTEFGLRELWT